MNERTMSELANAILGEIAYSTDTSYGRNNK